MAIQTGILNDIIPQYVWDIPEHAAERANNPFANLDESVFKPGGAGGWVVSGDDAGTILWGAPNAQGSLDLYEDKAMTRPLAKSDPERDYVGPRGAQQDAEGNYIDTPYDLALQKAKEPFNVSILGKDNSAATEWLNMFGNKVDVNSFGDFRDFVTQGFNKYQVPGHTGGLLGQLGDMAPGLAMSAFLDGLGLTGGFNDLGGGLGDWLSQFTGGGGGAGGSAAGAGTGGFDWAAADALGLTQMGQAAGLSGQALSDFVAAGGSAAGVGTGAAGIGAGTSGTGGVPGGNWYTNLDSTGLPTTSNPYDMFGLNGVGGAAGAGALSLSNILSQLGGGENATTDDWLKTLGLIGGTGLGVLGANSQTSALKDIYEQQRADRAPALNAFNALLTPEGIDNYYKSPEAMGALDAIMRKYVAQSGSVTDPYTLTRGAAYNLGGLTNARAGLAGPAFGGEQTQALLGSNIAQSEGGIYNALGTGLAGLTNPQKSAADQFKELMLIIGGARA